MVFILSGARLTALPFGGLRSHAFHEGRHLEQLDQVAAHEFLYVVLWKALEVVAPGRATISKVGLGMYSPICPRTMILVRPRTCTWSMARLGWSGKNSVNASCGSYRLLSPSQTPDRNAREMAQPPPKVSVIEH
jgi:hypothetical protein